MELCIALQLWGCPRNPLGKAQDSHNIILQISIGKHLASSTDSATQVHGTGELFRPKYNFAC